MCSRVSGSRQMDRESIGIYGLWAPASPLKIGIYCDNFWSSSIGTIDGIFSLVLTGKGLRLQFPVTSIHHSCSLSCTVPWHTD